MKNKKFYWLKLSKDFFVDPKMKKLRRIAGGEVYTIIYLKLMLLVLNTDGVIVYEGIEKTIEEEIALKLDEDDMNVKVLLSFLQAQNLIEEISDNSYLLPQAAEAIGSESSSAERVRKHRQIGKENQKVLQCNTYVTNGNEKVTLEKEKEKEEEEEEEEQIKEFAKWLPKKGAVKNFELFLEKIKNNIRNGDKKTLKNFEIFQKSNLEVNQNPINNENKAVERLENLKKILNSFTTNDIMKMDENTHYPTELDTTTIDYLISCGGLKAIKQSVLYDEGSHAYHLFKLGGAA